MNPNEEFKAAGSSINVQNLQQHLDSASNALARGQSQWFTPRVFGKACARGLPEFRQFICDLNCGSGQLLYAVANHKTLAMFGCDIDSVRSDKQQGDSIAISRIVGDVTKVYPLLLESNFKCDTFALNPPWDLHWYRDRLAGLAESDIASVRIAFGRHDGRVPKETIDSTVATMMMSLDLMSRKGIGFLIGNNATLQRLIFAPGAPHCDLAGHVYAHISIAGNPMTGIADSAFNKGEEFRTGVIWFGRGHYGGRALMQDVASMAEFEAAVARITLLNHFRGSYVYAEYQGHGDSPPAWGAVREEWSVREGRSKPEFNIWMTKDGLIQTYLTSFEKRSTKIDKDEIDRLHALNGQRPIQLVMQAAERAELNRAVNGGIWRVAPAVQELVRKAMLDYEAIRAPLFPLNSIQRLGYLDEEKFIRCHLDFIRNDKVIFSSGKSYTLESSSVHVERTRFKPSLGFGMDEYLLAGQELCFFITADDGAKYSFVDQRMTEEGVKVEIEEIHYTMQDLVKYFTIPDVPDVSVTNPDGYAANLAKLDAMEKLMA